MVMEWKTELLAFHNRKLTDCEPPAEHPLLTWGNLGFFDLQWHSHVSAISKRWTGSQWLQGLVQVHVQIFWCPSRIDASTVFWAMVSSYGVEVLLLNVFLCWKSRSFEGSVISITWLNVGCYSNQIISKALFPLTLLQRNRNSQTKWNLLKINSIYSYILLQFNINLAL